LNRILELESLRGIAALSVLYYHYTYFFRPYMKYEFSSTWDFKYGHHGVELFFMISGFVIFMSLDRVNNVKEFLHKRFVRLYPTYWICLLITLVVLFFNNTHEFNFTINEKALNILMFQGLFNIKNVDGSYWTLLPELLFYVSMIVLWKFKLTKKIVLVSVVWLILMYVALLRPSVIDILLNLKIWCFFYYWNNV
jgi:peptidoglycan/LPS O-acetylase OafA/YrhL